ncbi:iron-containing alcohol dehydrogenase [Rhodobacter sp. Har01]|uniref:iron-containing alcohol dehydrogenase n=1 Tax=Rhodobacter sp. Har01 TaxID=2883999 RepID=UPI001D08096A|nr:iron-containing alcohol dehydrogenase [Rhodobacter sp. Har01]MCB6178570.1 iron-containing alcohol dehydrogenase [Rhodobacter sp. Har01]
MTPFAIALPGQIQFGRGTAARAPVLIRAWGPRGVLVHGGSARRADWLLAALRAEGAEITVVSCPTEPTLPLLEVALARLRTGPAPAWVVAIGGGAAMDFGKALAALLPAPGGPMDHLEVVGKGLPLTANPLPFVALPTTAGTGAEATRNAVIGLPEHGRKVSLRDPRMLPRLAIVDPALTDHSPWSVTLGSGLDAVVQVIEPYLSRKATPFTDAITAPAIGHGLVALARLMQAEDPAARDEMAFVSLTGGMALANAGLGAVHGLAGVIGGLSPAPHGAVCGALIGPVLAANREVAAGETARRIAEVCATIARVLGGAATDAPQTLHAWAGDAGLLGLTAMGLDPALHARVAREALTSSSMAGNPVALDEAALLACLTAAA